MPTKVETKAGKKYFINLIPNADSTNAKKEQFRTYQLDGKTIEVPIGINVEVPEWVAKLAKEVGDITDYLVV